MKITSPVFKNNMKIPKQYTCDGENIHPPLAFHNIPEHTKSLLLILDDPDAPNGTFTHWILYDIPKDQAEIIETALPDGAGEGINSAGSVGYIGPCPPSGTHHYIFTLYALETILGIEGNPDKQIVLKYMKGHSIEKAELTGLYR